MKVGSLNLNPPPGRWVVLAGSGNQQGTQIQPCLSSAITPSRDTASAITSSHPESWRISGRKLEKGILSI